MKPADFDGLTYHRVLTVISGDRVYYGTFGSVDENTLILKKAKVAIYGNRVGKELVDILKIKLSEIESFSYKIPRR